jgi:DNA-binding NtrC family response regulator
MNYVRKRYHQGPSHTPPPLAPQRPPLIVLIEPDEAIRELLHDVLSLHGYCVRTAAPSVSAAAIAQLRPQGVIIDFGPILSHYRMHFLHELRLALAELDLAVLLTTTSTWIDATNAGSLRRLQCEVLYQPFELQSLLDWAAFRLPPGGAPRALM